VIRRPVRHPLPAVIATVSVLMCGGAVFAGLHGVQPAFKVVAERRIAGPVVGVAGLSVAKWDQQTGIRASLAVYYVSMTKHVSDDLVGWIESSADGARPIIDILPRGRSLASVAAGGADGWLGSLAAEIKAAKEKVVVAFAPEANGNWYTWGRQPRQFRFAWRHVWEILSAGTDNKSTHDISWMWQMSSHDRVGAYWPGPQYVDWVGIDGYFRFSTNTFGGLFDNTFKTVRRLTKSDPILLSETAAGPLTGAQPADITELFKAAAADRLIAVVWFDVKQSDPKDPPIHQNWKLYPGTAAMSAYQEAASAYLSSSRKKRSPK
jgi:mannan endo-1,4-beta-mannosidase